MTSNSDVKVAVGVATPFNVRQFARTARGNHRDSLDLLEFSTVALSPESLRVVCYLARLEGATMEHLRNVLVTATHKDARVTAFLVTWAFEKFWLADALDAVLEANGVQKSQNVVEGGSRRSASESAERRGPIRRAISAIRIGPPIVGFHMTAGLIDEWVTRAAYERLASAAASPALGTIIDLVLDVKSRHAAFFEDESRARLGESPRAARFTRRSVATSVWPIGAINRSDDDRSFFESYVFGGNTGRQLAAAIGQRIAQLPGLDARTATSITGKLLS